MKTQQNKIPVDHGTVLVATLVICAIMVTLLGSYLSLVRAQHVSVGRSQGWNQAMVVAEGGAEEALALLNSGVQAPNFAIFPWTGGNGVFKNDTNKPACKFGSSYYEVYITNAFVGSEPVICSRGYVMGPLGTPTLSRTIRVAARPRPTFPVKGPMIVMQSYDANGNNVGTDSFDSRNGPYDPNAAGTNGDVVTFSTNANSITVGNGKIKGNVRTPPGGVQGVTATVGSSGSVGDANWITTSKGFQDGHFMDDFTVAEFPPATLPNVGTWLPPMSGTAPDGLKYDNLLPGGNYQVADLNGSVYVGQTNTVLYVTSKIDIGSGGGKPKNGYAPAQIHIAPGASLAIYMAGASATIGGNGIVNDAERASAFAYYGLPGNTQISITGNGAFFGTIYAPQADFTLKGSGNTSVDDFTGSSVTRSTTMTGNFNFHYDESLVLLSTLGGYDPISWEEL